MSDTTEKLSRLEASIRERAGQTESARIAVAFAELVAQLPYEALHTWTEYIALVGGRVKPGEPRPMYLKDAIERVRQEVTKAARVPVEDRAVDAFIDKVENPKPAAAPVAEPEFEGSVTDFLRRIVRARDYHAEEGRYPPEYGITCFDDWAADIAETLLNRGQA